MCPSFSAHVSITSVLLAADRRSLNENSYISIDSSLLKKRTWWGRVSVLATCMPSSFKWLWDRIRCSIQSDQRKASQAATAVCLGILLGEKGGNFSEWTSHAASRGSSGICLNLRSSTTRVVNRQRHFVHAVFPLVRGKITLRVFKEAERR